MEKKIEVRIWVKHIKGADILCTKSYDALNSMLTEGFNNGSIGVKKGTKLLIEDEEYEIKEITTRLHNQTFEDDGQYGYNMYGAGGSTYPYNLEIYYYVEQV